MAFFKHRELLCLPSLLPGNTDELRREEAGARLSLLVTSSTSMGNPGESCIKSLTLSGLEPLGVDHRFAALHISKYLPGLSGSQRKQSSTYKALIQTSLHFPWHFMLV